MLLNKIQLFFSFYQSFFSLSHRSDHSLHVPRPHLTLFSLSLSLSHRSDHSSFHVPWPNLRIQTQWHGCQAPGDLDRISAKSSWKVSNEWINKHVTGSKCVTGSRCVTGSKCSPLCPCKSSGYSMSKHWGKKYSSRTFSTLLQASQVSKPSNLIQVTWRSRVTRTKFVMIFYFILKKTLLPAGRKSRVTRTKLVMFFQSAASGFSINSVRPISSKEMPSWSRSRPYVCIYMRTYMHVCIHVYVRTYIHTYIHT